MFRACAAGETAADPALSKISPTTPYYDICAALFAKSQTVAVGNGSSLVDKDKPVALLTLSESAAGEFALVFSMSHVVGDGRTYYEVFKMLQPGAAVRALDSKRVMDFSERMRDAYGRKELAWADSTSANLLYTFSMMRNPKPKCFAFHLDDEKVAAAKAQGAADGGVEYVTTNDILTSGFFNVCRARIGMMGFDCRDKGDLEGITKDLAGNYVTALVLDPEVFGTPASLRQMYTPGKPYETTKMPLPGCCCGNGRFAMATNWSSFATELISLEGCEMVVHLPMQNPAYICFNLMIPFAAGVGKTGVLIWTVSTDEAGLRQALPVGESVSQQLFPSA